MGCRSGRGHLRGATFHSTTAAAAATARFLSWVASYSDGVHSCSGYLATLCTVDAVHIALHFMRKLPTTIVVCVRPAVRRPSPW